MAEFKVKTKNNVDIGRKPRVYFCSHSDDFKKYFEKISEDIHRTHDCAIYYTEDMNEHISEDEKESDLGRNNLFVVPVTFKLLVEKNRAMDEDIPYAFSKHIPVLPFMMESGIDELYSLPERFGELQYLNPYSSDITEISYKDKLKKYLEAVLISDEMAKRVRAAFDAYIFLSYRKKDRKYANELMKLIHNIPECRDIAIWFDEFLTPGESFKESIEKMLKDSKLFTLLVTPNLLEMPNGKPNFVMSEEYPRAKDSGIEILPIEMDKTDHTELEKSYKELPSCVDPSDDISIKDHIMKSVMSLATEENNTPEHNFLIGLAYLDGIDVEVNRERATELIISAAESGLVEAMEKLYDMCSNGIGNEVDYNKALYWAERIYEYNKENFGEGHSATLTALNNVAGCCFNIGNYKRAVKLFERVYDLRSSLLGEENEETLNALDNVSCAYRVLGNYEEASKLGEKAYEKYRKALGESHINTLISLDNLAVLKSELKDHKTSAKLHKMAYEGFCEKLGFDHKDTLISMGNLAMEYSHLGEHKKAQKLMEKNFLICLETLGEEHPDTLSAMNNLAGVCYMIGEHEKALGLNQKTYKLRKTVLGAHHPETLTSLHNVAFSYVNLGNHNKAIELFERAYSLRLDLLGESHPKTLKTLYDLAGTYIIAGNKETGIGLLVEIYEICKEKYDESHPDFQNFQKFLYRLISENRH